MRGNDERVFDISFECTAANNGRMRNDITVRMRQPELAVYSLATDEGSFHGGDSSAPPPLALFSAGLAGCLMTQIRAFSKRLRVTVKSINVTGNFEWRCRQMGREPYVSEPVGFWLDIELETDAPLDEQVRLIEAAKKGCFVEQTLAMSNDIKHRLKTANGWRAV